MKLHDVCITLGQASYQAMLEEREPADAILNLPFKPYRNAKGTFQAAWVALCKWFRKLQPAERGAVAEGMLFSVAVAAVANGMPRPAFLAAAQRVFDQVYADRIDASKEES